MGVILNASVTGTVTPGSWSSGTIPSVAITWTTTSPGNTSLKIQALPLPGFDPLPDQPSQQASALNHTYNITNFFIDQGTSYGFYPVTVDPDSGDPMNGDTVTHPSGTYTIPVTFVPIASDLSVSSITTDSATISWIVTGLSTSLDNVSYGIGDYGQVSETVESNSENKQIVLNGLLSNTTYSFFGTSSSGVGSINTDSSSFTTLFIPQPPEDLIIGSFAPQGGGDILPGTTALSPYSNSPRFINPDTFMNNILR